MMTTPGSSVGMKFIARILQVLGPAAGPQASHRGWEAPHVVREFFWTCHPGARSIASLETIRTSGPRMVSFALDASLRRRPAARFAPCRHAAERLFRLPVDDETRAETVPGRGPRGLRSRPFHRPRTRAFSRPI